MFAILRLVKHASGFCARRVERLRVEHCGDFHREATKRGQRVKGRSLPASYSAERPCTTCRRHIMPSTSTQRALPSHMGLPVGTRRSNFHSYARVDPRNTLTFNPYNILFTETWNRSRIQFLATVQLRVDMAMSILPHPCHIQNLAPALRPELSIRFSALRYAIPQILNNYIISALLRQLQPQRCL